ncbi:hypothetical protein [Allobranchiibius sp. GilTou73]|uniref:hypothetical protein n=1 Tax=Allobranchiibius sp. GilTou73 TaxID=2904523 RepID=UPI001F23E4C7|nr:hypothetical protein [Allobranchiibius sp. GilTou73]UIJ35629.1 hypothetical protein LVQ62_04385 [Allobranchiibius sp. GilTou73]
MTSRAHDERRRDSGRLDRVTVTAPGAAFLAATALHAGFQATVTVLVYPALARIPTDRWAVEHDRHSRRITPLVGVVYLALAGATVWMLVADRGPWTYAGALLALAVAVVTGVGAAPVHGRLSRADPVLIARLLVIDRVRAVLGVLLLACACGAAFG